MSDSKPFAVVLVSGGLDSATVLAIARSAGYDCYALSFNYGQRHRFELEAAAKVCQSMGVVQHSVIELDLRAFGGSALTSNVAVPKDRSSVARPSQAVRFATGHGHVKRAPPGLGRPGDNDVAFA